MPKVNDRIRVRPPWERMMRIHQEIDRGDYPNASTLAESLDVSNRTILRDIDFMKYRLELPITYHPKRFGYAYSRKVNQFPSVAITEAEVFALLVAGKAVTQYRGTSFQRPLEMAFQKLIAQLDQTTCYTLGDLDKAFSFRPFAPEATDVEAFQVLLNGLRQHRAVAFQYKNLGAGVFKDRLAHPYHLACIENRWYLFAFDVDRQAMRTFALTRMRQMRITSQKFEPPKHFDPEEHLRGSFSVYKGSGDFEVVVDFDAWAADLLRGRQWHATQALTELPEGGVRLRMRLGSIKEVEGWVLSWGTHATVLQPPLLVERIRQITNELSQRYQPVPG